MYKLEFLWEATKKDKEKYLTGFTFQITINVSFDKKNHYNRSLTCREKKVVVLSSCAYLKCFINQFMCTRVRAVQVFIFLCQRLITK